MKQIFGILKKFFSNRLRAVIAVVLIVLLGVGIYKVTNKSSQQPQVQTQGVERGTIISSVTASGQVLTVNYIEISTSATGLIKKVYVKDGDQVVKGQKILEITLDPSSQQKAMAAYSSYLSAKNSLESAQTTLYTLDSQMWAANQKFINDAVSRGLLVYDPTYIQEHDDWLAAEAKYINQKNVINQSRLALNNSWQAYQAVSPIVSAPMSGVITNLTYTEKMSLSATSDTSQRIAVIHLEENPFATFNVSEIDIPNVKPGQKATIQLDSILDKTFTGKVVTVDRIGSVTSGVASYPVVIQLDTQSPQILPNMSAIATIILEVKNGVLLVPSSAIQRQGDQYTVRVQNGKQIQTVTVETGLSSDVQTEVISGLSEGDQVVTSAITSTTSQTGRSVFGGGGFGGGAGRAIFSR